MHTGILASKLLLFSSYGKPQLGRKRWSMCMTFVTSVMYMTFVIGTFIMTSVMCMPSWPVGVVKLWHNQSH